MEGPSEIIATDNGDAANIVSFTSTKRAAFNGLYLVIVREKPGQPGTINVKANYDGLQDSKISIGSERK
nr:hypothetical protein [Pedobacter mongoliensis]